MSPKHAIKMIKIQKSYSVHINSVDLFCPLWSNLVLFSPFYLLKLYLVQFSPFGLIQSTQSTLALFGPILSTLVLFGPFCPLCPIRSIMSTLDLFGPIWSILVLFSPFCPLWFYSVHFGPIQSYSVHLIPIRSYSIHLVQFGPIASLRFILVHLDLFLCTYIMGKDMFGLKAPNLNPKLLKKYILLIRLYACNYCCYVFVGKRHVWKKTSNI